MRGVSLALGETVSRCPAAWAALLKPRPGTKIFRPPPPLLRAGAEGSVRFRRGGDRRRKKGRIAVAKADVEAMILGAKPVA